MPTAPPPRRIPALVHAVAFAGVLVVGVAAKGGRHAGEADAPAAAATADRGADEVAAAINQRMYRWPTSGRATFTLRTATLATELANARKAAPGNPEVAAGVAMLEGLSMRGALDFATGAVTTEVATTAPPSDPARMGGLEQVRTGTQQMVSGLVLALDMYRKPFLAPGSVRSLVRDGDRFVADVLEGGTPTTYTVAAETLLPLSGEVPTPAGPVVTTWSGWKAVGDRHLLSDMEASVQGKVAARIHIEYQDVGGVWFPARVDMSRDVPVETVWFEDVVITR